MSPYDNTTSDSCIPTVGEIGFSGEIIFVVGRVVPRAPLLKSQTSNF
jgi:hypothetical protein